MVARGVPFEEGRAALLRICRTSLAGVCAVSSRPKMLVMCASAAFKVSIAMPSMTQTRRLEVDRLLPRVAVAEDRDRGVVRPP